MNKKHTLWLTIAVLIFITLFAALFATGALHGAINFILHIDRHLTELSAQYGVWIYAILFVIVFCETGLVITPFLPGDSLLFAAGSIAALGSMNIHTFYAKHGGKTIILARFVPIVRTFAPFVAGMGHMSYGRFFHFNVIGGIAWVALFSYAGFWFGQQPIVKENLTLILLAIIIISVLPAIIEIIRARRV